MHTCDTIAECSSLHTLFAGSWLVQCTASYLLMAVTWLLSANMSHALRTPRAPVLNLYRVSMHRSAVAAHLVGVGQRVLVRALRAPVLNLYRVSMHRSAVAAHLVGVGQRVLVRALRAPRVAAEAQRHQPQHQRGRHARCKQLARQQEQVHAAAWGRRRDTGLKVSKPEMKALGFTVGSLLRG